MNQPLFLAQSVAHSIQLLRDHEPAEGFYLAFSGGKDSVVVHRLCEMGGVKFDAHRNPTPDPPELIKFVREFFPNVIHDRAEETMWTLIPKKLFPPNRRGRYCCSVLKEAGGDDRFVLTGVRSAESPRRKAWKEISFCPSRGKVIIHPILNWTDDEVWAFIRSENIPYCELYDQGFKRIGCVGCPLTSNQAAELKMYPKIELAWLHAFGRMLIERRRRGKPTTWKTAEEVMAWFKGEKNDHQGQRDQVSGMPDMDGEDMDCGGYLYG